MNSKAAELKIPSNPDHAGEMNSKAAEDKIPSNLEPTGRTNHHHPFHLGIEGI